MEETQKKVEKVLQGRVVSNKMQKTIVVEIHQRKLHRSVQEVPDADEEDQGAR